MKRLVVIGAGNMAEALVAGLVRRGCWKPSQIVVTDLRSRQRRRLARTYNVAASADNASAVRKADIVLLAVKPPQMHGVLSEIGPWLRKNQLVLSIAAGIPTRVIESFLGRGVPVIRIMPNTPALVGMGAAALARGRFAKAAHERLACGMMETVGTVVTLREKDMDAVTAVSGSGPAYVFYLAEAMKEAGVKLGLRPQVADALVRQTIRGAGELLAQSKEDPRMLRRRVTSPGGTTQAALNVMEKARLKAVVHQALQQASKRSRALSKEAAPR
jgi:pyrroline-5-carboxylate reductase